MTAKQREPEPEQTRYTAAHERPLPGSEYTCPSCGTRFTVPPVDAVTEYGACPNQNCPRYAWDRETA